MRRYKHDNRPLLWRKLTHDLESTATGHFNIEKYNVRLFGQNRFDRFTSVSTLPDDLNARLPFKQRLQSLPGEGFVVYDNYTGLAHRIR
jgi:hypothetical protein